MARGLDLKILASHPVQYQAPLFRELVDAGLGVSVAYYHQGMAGQPARDAEFGIDVQWDIDLLSGYPHFFFHQIARWGLKEQIQVAPRLLAWALNGRQNPLLLIGWFAEIVWLVWFLCILLHVPVMTLGDNTLLSYRALPRPRWREVLLRWLLCHSSAHLSVGTRNREFLTNMGVRPDRIYYTPHSVANARFADTARQLLSRRQELCHDYGILPDLPVFLFCGKLIRKKRPVELLEAYVAAGLQDRAQLLYVGDGPLRNAITQRISDSHLGNVHLLGFLNQTQMPMAYVLGEVLCLVSDPTETWGLAVNEALACGRPVIVSQTVGCAPDLVTSANGWITPLDDHRALVQVFRKAFEQRVRWPVMGSVGQELIAGHTFSVMVEGIRSALARVSG